MDCCASSEKGQPCCRVEYVVSVDERGQMVLPKELRDKAHIKAGDKLALVICGQGEGVDCLALIKVEELSGFVRQMLSPVFGEAPK